MSKLAVLTKPRFSILHFVSFAVLFVLTFIVASTIFNNWSDFKSGFCDGYTRASAR
jgi:hypothetical protein